MLYYSETDITAAKAEAVIVPVCRDAALHADAHIARQIEHAAEVGNFRGEKEDELVFYHPPGFRLQRLILVGMGELKKIDAEALRRVAGRMIRYCIRKELSEALIAVPDPSKLELEEQAVLEALMEGACLANHAFDRYKKEKKQTVLTGIGFMVPSHIRASFPGLPEKVDLLCRGTIMARDWVNTPSNDKTPEKWAGAVTTLAEAERIAVTVLDETQLSEQQFGALMAVAAGSCNTPRLLVMEYRHPEARRTIALVGKGVTFDSGGINLKPSASLEDMKADMAGGAAVAAALITVARLGSRVNLVGIVPAVENMPSGDATRPGDIISSYAGKSVEIGNTDAEGRLILADAMAYAARRFSPQILIDVATLTGACVVALGEKIAGVFSPDDPLADAIISAGTRKGERCWRMPMPEDYRDMLKSELADIRNIGKSRYGGAITAALFLSEFVEEGIRWAHIDIAGPAFTQKESDYAAPGATGFGVRLLCELIETLQKSEHIRE